FEEAVAQIRTGVLDNPISRAGRVWLNLPSITDGTMHNAYFNAFLDEDGSIRRSNIVSRVGDKYVASLALKTLMVVRNANVQLSLARDIATNDKKKISDLSLTDAETAETLQTIPVDNEGRLIVNYAGPRQMFPYVSVYELFNGKDTATISYRKSANEIVEETVDKAEFFKDKIIIFGATAVGIYDLRVTPFEENYPGVETHANLVDNMLRQDYLRPHPDEHLYMIAAILAVGLLLSFALSRLGAAPGLLLTLLFLGLMWFVDKFYMFKNGILVSVIFPALLISSLYVVLTFYKYLTEERKKKAIKGTFEKYVSPAIVAEVLKDPSNLELGGKKQRMTVMFSDVRGFTTISEKLDPQALSAMLNKYLTPMTELVFKNKGTLDKYMGDAIMAFFGAPIHYPDHAKMGVQCALDMIALLPKMNEEFAQRGLPPIDIGIGLNTGDMSVGNMGSETVRSYTVMGDAVNLASRLEGINKQYGTRIIVSEFTFGEIKDEFICREVDWVRVKGKLQPVRIYEVIARKGAIAKNPALLEWFEKGFSAYHSQNWGGAIDCFTEALNVDPDDAPSKLYLQRSSAYRESPPPKDWDGVFEMKTK
ncbi:MAG TPA: adenylate/guanylate cyclase domain-containing protein, partial [Bdellovibrionales bacterium]|nr:adenylate/guanylate cyclase domain-containing protein [Bdellovibrionales bacterium]